MFSNIRKSGLFWYTFAFLKFLVKSGRISMSFSKILCILCESLPYFSACEAEKWMEMCLWMEMSNNYDSTTQAVHWLKPLYFEFSSPSVPQTLFYGHCFQSNLYLWQIQWRYHKSQQCCYVGLSRGRVIFREALLGGSRLHQV